MKKTFSYILGFTGILGITLFLEHIMGFTEHNYFYIQNPDITKYVGTNVVSRWADLSFFTYHTLIFFSIWCILQFIANVFNLKMFSSFLYRKDLIAFITTNYIITSVVYTIFELSTVNPTFGLYANTPKAWHNFGTNIMVHYILSIICIANYLLIQTKKCNYKRSYIYISLYLLIYFIIVKLTGSSCYRIIWYPYPIFDSESLLNLLGFKTNSLFLATTILIIINLLIYFIYMFIYTILLKKKKNTEG